MSSGSLTVVGTGIRLVAQATYEAVAAMEEAQKLLYLVAEPATEEWVRSLNTTAESLYDCYGAEEAAKDRGEAYRDMVDRILSWIRRGSDVCVAFYGHPGVFVYPSHAAIRAARSEGYPARMLPGISAEDCLFADLGIDPAADGCASFETTDFLVSGRVFDPASSLILWQIGMIGEAGPAQQAEKSRRNLGVLVEVLQRHYPPHHEVVLYEAAQYPVCKPVIERVALSSLGQARVSMLTTLFVPPAAKKRSDTAMLERLGMYQAYPAR